MVTTIKQPFRSPPIVLILNRIHEVDQPYASGIADSLGDQVTDIQTYLDTMHEHGWISKEREGRRQVLSINPKAIWRDSKYRRKITRGSIFGEDTNGMNEDLERLLANALLYKLFYAVETTTNDTYVSNVDDDSEIWVKGPDTLLDNDEMVWYGCDTTLNELLAEIVGTIKTLSILTAEEEPAIEIFTSAYDAWFIDHCHDIIHGNEPVDDLEDLVQDMVEHPEEYI